MLLLLFLAVLDPQRVVREAQMTLDYQRLRGVMMEAPAPEREPALQAFRTTYESESQAPELIAVLAALKSPATAKLPDLLVALLAQCEQRDAMACARVGRFYQRGAWPMPGIQEDEAFRALHAACSEAAPACVWAGDIARGLSLIDGNKIADPLYERACKNGWLDGCTRLLQASKGVQPALRDRACALGHAASCDAIAAEKAQLSAKRLENEMKARRTRRGVGIGFTITAGILGLSALGTFLGSLAIVGDIRTNQAASIDEVSSKISTAGGIRTMSLAFVIPAGVAAVIGLPLLFTSLGDGATLQVSSNGSGVSVSGTF